MLEVRNLRKVFRVGGNEVEALGNVTQGVAEGEFFVLLGPSGSGKTTLLRCVAGLEMPDAGEIEIDGATVFSGSRGICAPPEDRKIGMVFQSYAIWPHMTVFQNVALPLTRGRKKIAKTLVREQVYESLKLVQLEDYAERPSPLLSGGQQQRVALARALAVNPKLLLMDEPLSNLDARLREDMRGQIRDLAKRLNITVLYVTHDQVEAMVVADRIAVMSLGAIVSVGAPEELYEGPANRVVAEFFGSINWMDAQTAGGGTIDTTLGSLKTLRADQAGLAGTLGIRPEDLEVSPVPTGRDNEFEGELVSRTFLGDQSVHEVRVAGILLHIKTMEKAPINDRVYVTLPKERIKFFPGSPQSGVPYEGPVTHPPEVPLHRTIRVRDADDEFSVRQQGETS